MHPVLGLLASLACSGAMALPTIDFAAAKGFSAFILGNVDQANDIEGRLAVGGNLTASGLSINYRTPSTVKGPALVVGGDVNFTGGRIYSNAPAGVDTTKGSHLPYWDQGLGKYGNSYGVFGGSKAGSSDFHDLRQQSGLIDFNAAATTLRNTTNQLGSLSATGKTQVNTYVDNGKTVVGSINFVGTGSDFEVFNVNTATFRNLSLSGVKAGATVVINYTGSDAVLFAGGQLTQSVGIGSLDAWGKPATQLEALNSNVLFNFNKATDVTVASFVGGSILAPNALVYGGETRTGGGHLEGQLIALGLKTNLEVGYSPLVSAVPEPQTYAMLLAGLGVLGFLSRRRQRGG
ncbi:MAG: collagen-binding domain-containing protein [Burkholderiaceae bacterium]